MSKKKRVKDSVSAKTDTKPTADSSATADTDATEATDTPRSGLKRFGKEVSTRMADHHKASLKQFHEDKAGKQQSSGYGVRFFLFDVLLLLVLMAVMFLLLLFIQTVGAATVDVALANGQAHTPISQIIFTSAVAGGLCGAVLTWTPRLFMTIRTAARKKLTRDS